MTIDDKEIYVPNDAVWLVKIDDETFRATDSMPAMAVAVVHAQRRIAEGIMNPDNAPDVYVELWAGGKKVLSFAVIEMGEEYE